MLQASSPCQRAPCGVCPPVAWCVGLAAHNPTLVLSPCELAYLGLGSSTRPASAPVLVRPCVVACLPPASASPPHTSHMPRALALLALALALALAPGHAGARSLRQADSTTATISGALPPFKRSGIMIQRCLRSGCRARASGLTLGRGPAWLDPFVTNPTTPAGMAIIITRDDPGRKTSK